MLKNITESIDTLAYQKVPIKYEEKRLSHHLKGYFFALLTAASFTICNILVKKASKLASSDHLFIFYLVNLILMSSNYPIYSGTVH